MAAACSMHVGEEKYIGVLMMGKPVIDHLENTCKDEKIIFKLIFQKQAERDWTGHIWIGIEKSGGHLQTW